ncbi:MAG: TetR family transcriptional regulator [Micromonosporaceae bacterium]|nr:TetR family transcriptional regulator [Micromonosporaceae bacterium]
MTTTASARGREVRHRLLAAATELIPEVGWSSVSTRLLAERAGVAPGLVHYHFESLAVLLRQAALDVFRQALSGTEAALAPAPDLDAGLELLLASLDGYSGADPTSLLFIETYLAATRDQALGDELAELLYEFRSRLASWLRQHGAGDPEQTAAVLAAAVDGVMLHRALDPGLTSATVSPALRRLLATGPDRRRDT